MQTLYFDGLNDDAITEMVEDDFRSAEESRAKVEERKVRDYALYRRFRRELTDGGIEEGSRGPFNYSNITVPLVFWIVETILPRIGVQPPTVTLTARDPSLAPFVEAAQMRVTHNLRRGCYEQDMMLAIKQFLILGDSPIKVYIDEHLGGPRMLPVNWFDWFISAEAQRYEEAEVWFHRMFYSRRGLEMLLKRDAHRVDKLTGERLPKLYDHDAMEAILHTGARRDSEDRTHAERRRITGLGPETLPDRDGQICIVEAWYKDGSRVYFAPEQRRVVRLVREPTHLDAKDRPFRPFTVLQNTPDLFQPYSISDAEMLEDHQEEASTLRNQLIDQTTFNINAPTGVDRERVDPAEVQEAFGQPGGVFYTEGPPTNAVVRFPPGNNTSDYRAIYEEVRSEAQIISGATDLAAGLTSAVGVANETATGASIIREEANARFRLKLKLVQLGMRTGARLFMELDRMAGAPDIVMKAPNGMSVSDVLGIAPAGNGYVTVPGIGGDFEVDVDAGAMAPPAQSEQATKLRQLLIDLGHPAIAPLVNWPELARQLVESQGYEPERILLSEEQLAMMQEQMAVQQGAGQPGGEPLPPGDPGNEIAPQQATAGVA